MIKLTCEPRSCEEDGGVPTDEADDLKGLRKSEFEGTEIDD